MKADTNDAEKKVEKALTEIEKQAQKNDDEDNFYLQAMVSGTAIAVAIGLIAILIIAAFGALVVVAYAIVFFAAFIAVLSKAEDFLNFVDDHFMGILGAIILLASTMAIVKMYQG